MFCILYRFAFGGNKGICHLKVKSIFGLFWSLNLLISLGQCLLAMPAVRYMVGLMHRSCSYYCEKISFYSMQISHSVYSLLLCNPNFVHSKIINISVWTLHISSTHLHLLPKMLNRKCLLPLSRADSLFCDHVLVLFCLQGSMKGECLLSCATVTVGDDVREKQCAERQA